MNIVGPLTQIFSRVKSQLEEAKYKKIAQHYDISGYRRIYQIHIRKTGGTSLNFMFFSLCNQDPKEVYQELQQTLNYRIIKKSMIYVGWNQALIQRGNYFYAFSHIPLHKLSIQNNTFTITCFRDPIQRIISHYNMLMEYKVNGIFNNDMAVEGHYLGDTFLDFINQLPSEKLLNQLFMFSKNFDIDEALEQISKLNHYFFSENFEDGIHQLNSKINLNLKPLHIRKSKYKENFPSSSIDHLRELLDKEYCIMSAIKSM